MTSEATTYRPGLDGIRAIAVGAVLLFHLDRLPGGNLGVDAFFVLSGWLITWRLLGEADRAGTISLRAFWTARIRRIVPASLAVLVAISIAWPLAGIEVSSLRRDVVWAAGWVSNWGTITGGGDYWARFGEVSPVTHYWSLAIEEQFYVVWPLVVFAVARWTRAPRAAVGIVSALAAVGSIALMNLSFDAGDATATYMNTFSRAHSLLIGAVAAAITTVGSDGSLRGAATARRLAPVGGVIAVTIVALSSEEATWMFRFGFPVFALAVVVVVVAAADGAGRSMLASAPLRWLGDRSYGLYLWHWPVFLLLSPERLEVSGTVATALVDVGRVAIAVLLADVSHRFLEQPIRRRRQVRPRTAVALAAVSAAAVIAVASTLVPLSSSPAEESVVTLAPPPSPVPTAGEPTAATSTEPAGEPTPTAPAPTSTEPAPTTTPAPAEPLPPLRVLVTGDSTGVQLADALIEYAAGVPDEMVVGSAAAAGCGLTASDDGRLHEFTNTDGRRELIDLSACVSQWASVEQRITDEAIDAVLVYVGPWDSVDIHLADDSVVSVGDPVGAQLVTDAYERFVAALERAGATPVWVVPADTNLGWGDIDDPLNDPERWTAMRAIIGRLAVVPIDLAGWLVEEGLDGPEGRPDGVHLTPELNERFVAEVVAPTLDDVRHGRQRA